MKLRYFCDLCGTEVPKNTIRCPSCGRYFTAIQCPRCGFRGEEKDFAQAEQGPQPPEKDSSVPAGRLSGHSGAPFAPGTGWGVSPDRHPPGCDFGRSGGDSLSTLTPGCPSCLARPAGCTPLVEDTQSHPSEQIEVVRGCELPGHRGGEEQLGVGDQPVRLQCGLEGDVQT
jgi:hypothetical protein